MNVAKISASIFYKFLTFVITNFLPPGDRPVADILDSDSAGFNAARNFAAGEIVNVAVSTALDKHLAAQ